MKKKRVTLEPALEEQVSLCTASQRVQLARKFERWAHQLRVSAFILRRDELPKPKQGLKPICRRRQAMN